MNDDDERESEESTLDRYDAAVTAIEKPVSDLKAYSEKTRSLVWAMGASIVFNIILLSLFALSLLKLFDLSDDVKQQADFSTQYQIANCESNNDSRAGQRHLWTTIFDIVPEIPRTKKEQANVRKLRALVNETFPVRDCSHVTEGRVK